MRPIITNAMINAGATLARSIDYTVPSITLSSLVALPNAIYVSHMI